MKHAVGRIDGLDLQGYESPKKKGRTRKQRKSAKADLASSIAAAVESLSDEEVSDVDERQRHHMKYDVGRMDGLDIIGMSSHSPPLKKKRDRRKSLPNKHLASPTRLKPSSGTGPLAGILFNAADEDSGDEHKGKYDRRFEVGRMDGLDLMGYEDDNEAHEEIEVGMVRAGSAKARFTAHPSKKQLKKYQVKGTPHPSTKRGHHDVTYNVGRMDGLDLTGYSDDDKYQDGEQVDETAVFVRPNSAKAYLTSPIPSRTRPPVEIITRPKHDVKFDVGRFDGLDLQGFEADDSSVELVERSRLRRHSAKPKFTSPKKKSNQESLIQEANDAIKGSYDRKFDVGRIDGLDLYGYMEKRDADPDFVSPEIFGKRRRARRNSAKPKFTSPKPPPVSLEDEDERNFFDIKFDVGRLDGLGIEGFEKYKKKEMAAGKKIKRVGSAKPTFSSPSRVTFADESQAERPKKKHSVKYNVPIDGLDIESGGRILYKGRKNTGDLPAKPPRGRSARAKFASPNSKNVPSEHRREELIDTVLFGEVDPNAAPENVKEKFEFAAGRVKSARRRMEEAQNQLIEQRNRGAAEALAVKLAAEASLNAQLAIQKHKNDKMLDTIRLQKEEEARQIKEEGEREMMKVAIEAKKRQTELNDWISRQSATEKELEIAKEEHERIIQVAREEQTRIQEQANGMLKEKEAELQDLIVKSEAAMVTAKAVMIAEQNRKDSALLAEIEAMKKQHEADLHRKLESRERERKLELEAVKKQHEADLQRVLDSRERERKGLEQEYELKLEENAEIARVNVQKALDCLHVKQKTVVLTIFTFK